MGIYSLAESRDMIFSKLADMTPEKQRRYETVYCKLRDFEAFLKDNGVGPDMEDAVLGPTVIKDPALLTSAEARAALARMTFESNVRLMHTITAERSFDRLLEEARGERTTASVRTYLRLLDEYSTYMTRAGKQKTLKFLYELLMHHEGDVRRRASELMGQILANSGPSYRKELPQAAPKSALAPAMMAVLDKSAEVWESYLLQCLHPDRRITAGHAQRISNSLKAITGSLFEHCNRAEGPALAAPVLRLLTESTGEDRFVLADALSHIPCWP